MPEKEEEEEEEEEEDMKELRGDMAHARVGSRTGGASSSGDAGTVVAMTLLVRGEEANNDPQDDLLR
jgi:hypothetical protein